MTLSSSTKSSSVVTSTREVVEVARPDCAKFLDTGRIGPLLANAHPLLAQRKNRFPTYFSKKTDQRSIENATGTLGSLLNLVCEG